MSLLFHGLGLVLALGLFALTLRLTGTRVAAYVCTGLVVLSPGFVLYENWLMYTFLEAVLLTTSAVALYQTLDRGSMAWGVALFTALAALVLTRGMFHLGWFVLVVAYVAWAATNRKQIVAAAALPLLAATLWYAKNYFYFGAFAGSTMFGLGLSNIGTLTVPRADLEPLVEQGIVSPLALVSRYEDVGLLFAARNEQPSGIPVLDRPRKADGQYNYNYRPLIALNEQYARDSMAVIRRYPASYAIGVIVANRLFFSPSSMNEYFSPQNRAAAEAVRAFVQSRALRRARRAGLHRATAFRLRRAAVARGQHERNADRGVGARVGARLGARASSCSCGQSRTAWPSSLWAICCS